MGRLTPEERSGIWALVDDVMDSRGLTEWTESVSWENKAEIASCVTMLIDTLDAVLAEEVEA